MAEDQALAAQRDHYLERVRGLLAQFESWSESYGLHSEPFEVTLEEQDIEPYSAPALRILDANREIARLEPRGSRIVAAEGRVDLVGGIAAAVLSYLPDGGPVFETSLRVGDEVRTQRTRFYRGVGPAGWYWVETGIGEAHDLTRDRFLTLLLYVSDYELAA